MSGTSGPETNPPVTLCSLSCLLSNSLNLFKYISNSAASFKISSSIFNNSLSLSSTVGNFAVPYLSKSVIIFLRSDSNFLYSF